MGNPEEVYLPKSYLAMKRLKRTIEAAADKGLSIILVILLLAIVLFLISPYKPLVIMTDSMVPILPVGSIVIAERVSDPGSLAVGDIVTYKRPGVPVTITHRIIELTEDGVITKGDNLEKADDLILYEWIAYRIKWHK